MEKYDTIIVGSGINGLIAAIYQSMKDRRVLILETQTSFGGAIKTSECISSDFKIEPFAGYHANFVGSRVYTELNPKLSKYGLKYIKFENSFGSIFPDKRFVRIGPDIDNSCESISQFSQLDGNSWRERFSYYQGIKEEIGHFLSTDINSTRNFILSLFRFYRKLGKGGALSLIQTLMMTPRAFCENYFQTPEVQSMFVAWGMHPDMSPESAFGATHVFLTASKLQESGMSIPVRGGSALIDAILKLLSEKRVEMIAGTRVTKIIVQNDTAVGVKTSKGEEFQATKAVIANVEPRALFLNLIGASALPPDFVSEITKWRYGFGSFKIDLALDSKPNWIGGDEVWKTGVIHIGPFINDISRAANEAVRGLIPADPFLVVGHHSSIDNTRAPVGKHTLWLLCRGVPSTILGDALGVIKSRDWNYAKILFAQRCLDKLKRYVSNLDEIVVGRYIQSPLDLGRENSNFIGGDPNGGSQQLDQNLLFRPTGGYGFSTPIKRLHITGAFTWPGSGLSGLSGYHVGKKA